MVKALGWGFVLGLSLSLGLACSSSGGGSGGTGGGSALLEDGGYAHGPSYRPCLSNMECSPFESCTAFYYSGFTYTSGICTRACFDDSDCFGDKCRNAYPYTATNVSIHACIKGCSATADCRSGLICGDAGVCEIYVPVGVQSAECAQYVKCYEKTGGTPGSLDSSYGSAGTCWTSGASAAASCTAACKTAIQSLTSAYPDAGC